MSMAGPSKKQTVDALLERGGTAYAEELGIKLGRATPSALFRLLCAAALYSARIDSSIATEAARNLQRRGWTTAHKLCESTWNQRVKALGDAGYTRYQERTATMLADSSQELLERWDGDLRNLRDEAERPRPPADAPRRRARRTPGGVLARRTPRRLEARRSASACLMRTEPARWRS